MKNKKGFTIIEIIVSLTIILLIGGTVIGLTITNNKKKEEKILEVTKKIQEAAGVYLSINKEIDSTIEQNILNGGTGYVIPLKTLLDNGYIGNNHIKILTENIADFKINKHYMLAGVFSNTTQCDNNQSTITIQASYDLENESNEYYLCNFTTEKLYTFYNLDGGYFTDGTPQVKMFVKGSNESLKDGRNGVVKKDDISNFRYTFKEWRTAKDCGGTVVTNINNQDNNVIYACYEKTILQREVTLKDMMNTAKFSNNIGKTAISEQACIANGIDPSVGNDNVVCNENGLFLDRDKTNGITYYYFRGAVENNYVKLANKLWRILWINSNKEAKLILDDAVNLTVKNKNNQNITLKSDDSISYMYIADIQNRPNDSILHDRSYKIPRSYYILHRNNSGQTINGLFSNCSEESVDCTRPNGNNYTWTITKTYQNLNISDYLISYNFVRNKVLDSDIYITAFNNFLNSIKNNTVFKAVVPANLNWYYYTTNYWNEKSIYYKRNGCNCRNISSCCYNRNFPSSFEVDNNSYNSTQYISSKIGLINYHELRMAGLSEISVINSDNFIIKDKNNEKSNFLIADYNKEHNSEWDEENRNENKYGDRWYYVDANSGNISNYQVQRFSEDSISNVLLRTYDQNKTLDSCSATTFSNKSRICSDTSNADGSILLGSHAYDDISLYTMVANNIKPVVVIKMNEYSLSNNTGTSNDPYELVK